MIYLGFSMIAWINLNFCFIPSEYFDTNIINFCEYPVKYPR